MSHHNVRPSQLDIPTICFGFTLGFATLTISKAGKQTLSVVRRKRAWFNPYLFMIWVEIFVCLAMAILSWLFVRGDIGAQLWYFLTLVTLWSIQLQLLLQIIANRIALILPNAHDGKRLKLYLFAAVLFINITVYCIWVPARMQVSPAWVKLNDVWDRIEKVIYLIIDAGLNVYFLYLVKVRLVDAGLTKYKELWRYNAGIAFISISMDLLIIAMMSLPNDLVYVQFHPLSFMIKLNIELCMSDLISKVVRKRDRTDKPHEYSSSAPSQGTLPFGGACPHSSSRGTTTLANSTIGGGPISTTADVDVELAPVSLRKRADGKIVAADSDALSVCSIESGINFRVPERREGGITRVAAMQMTTAGGERPPWEMSEDEARSQKSAAATPRAASPWM